MEIFAKYYALIFTLLQIMPSSLYAKNHLPILGLGCDLPAPSSLSVKGVSTTWVSLEWEEVYGVNQYQVEAFSSPTSTIVSTWVVEANSFTVPNLEGGKAYFFQVSAICNENGTSSPKTIGTSQIYTIVIDLKAEAYLPQPMGMINCEISNEPIGSCYFSCEGSMFWGQVYINQSYSRSFLLQPEESPNFEIATKLKFYRVIENGVPNGILNFVTDNSEGSGSSDFILVLNNGIQILKITVIKNPCVIHVNFYEDFYTEYGFREITFPPGADNKSIINQDDTITSSNSLKISTLSTETTIPTHLQLFNLNGILQLRQTLQPNQNYQDLLTPDLPAGFYFLRLETAGVIETRKLVKTQ